MAESVTWMYSARALRGPSVGSSGTLEVDAYQKINVTLPTGGAAQQVTIGPGTWAELTAVVISASDLGGVVDVTPDGGNTFPLDGPLVLIGAGPVSLLGAGDATVELLNNGAADVDVDIFVARDATP
jgi:hypothetical protein